MGLNSHELYIKKRANVFQKRIIAEWKGVSVRTVLLHLF